MSGLTTETRPTGEHCVRRGLVKLGGDERAKARTTNSESPVKKDGDASFAEAVEPRDREMRSRGEEELLTGRTRLI
jgi:hypothetical protein